MLTELETQALEALKRNMMFQLREGEDYNDAFERVADTFYQETGYLRPGKDCCLHSPEVREAVWDEWLDANRAIARAAIEALESALAAPAQEPLSQADASPIAAQWLPIETAPKDSTSILIYTPNSRRVVREAWWAIPYEGSPDGYWSTPIGPTGRGYTILPEAVTHWMPLPDPPALREALKDKP